MTNIKQKLQKKSKEWLVERLLELAVADGANEDRILLSLSSDEEDSKKFVAKCKRQIDKGSAAIVAHGPGSWTSQLPTAGFDSVADTLAVSLSTKLKEAIEISEYALIKLDGVFELQDECELEYLVDAFLGLHLEACCRLRPDPVALGERFAELTKQTEWEFFDGPPDGYHEVLGNEGLSAFCSKLERPF